MQKHRFTTTFAGKELIIESGTIAQRANASCTVQMGDTVILATAVMGDDPRPGMGWFPLMVDYEEKLYAAGRIKGSRFIKREGRPTDEAVLIARFIDRAIRPLFDQRIKNDVQVIITCLSFDGENDPDILGLIGASCVLHMSDIPWNGPIGAIRMSQLDGEWLANPSYEQREKTDFDLDIAGTTEKVVMIEARANEADEAALAEAFERGRAEMTPVIELIEEVRAKLGKEKRDLFATNTEEEKAHLAERERVENMARTFMIPQIEELFFAMPRATKDDRGKAMKELKKRLVQHLEAQGVEEDFHGYATDLIYDFVQMELARHIVEGGRRVDGRGIEEIRDLASQVGLLPRTHGSGLFDRGETQILSVCTLGAPGDAQVLDNMETVGEQRYMHHYNFPPYSVGEAKPLRGAGRREIGHGALAEKALEPVIPSKEDFPYTIRVVSETMNSNGSSSMGSTCGSTLALMDAGVPIKKPVAGIAIGLATHGDKQVVIMDLQDLEDGPGGMDFKVTGTRDGVTAIQMDTKTQGLTHDVVVEALRLAKNGRNQIIDVIEGAIQQPNELSAFAPRIMKLHINPDKIREVIGPGGKMINEIIDTTGVEAIDIEQDGLVIITAKDGESGQRAYDWVHNLTREVEVGEEFEGQVVRMMDFGAFVNILPGKDGLVHVSELAPWRVAKPDDIVKEGDTVKVKIIEIDSSNRINLSMKQAQGNVYTEEMKAKAQKSPVRSEKPHQKGDKPQRKPRPKSRD